MDKHLNVSPLRYPGGKTRACKSLDIILNENFDIKTFNKLVSPFFGGGSFEFHLQNKYGLEIIANDILNQNADAKGDENSLQSNYKRIKYETNIN